jgi:hypothetical protein
MLTFPLILKYYYTLTIGRQLSRGSTFVMSPTEAAESEHVDRWYARDKGWRLGGLRVFGAVR